MKRLLVIVALLGIVDLSAAACDVNIGTPVTPSEIKDDKAPVINSFTTDNAILNAGQSTNLRWGATGSCRIDPLVGDVPNSGFTPITPSSTTIYVLSCTNNNQSVSRIVTVTVR